MSFEEMVVALVASIGGILLVGFVFAKITGLIKAWINRSNNSYLEEDFDRLAKAFMQYKKDTERRLQNLEAIVSEDDLPKIEKKKEKSLNEPEKEVEIDDENQDNTGAGNNNLKNMLRE